MSDVSFTTREKSRMKIRMRQRALELSTLVIAVAASLLVLNRPSIYVGSFLGDDLQMWGGHLDGTYASNLQESLRNGSSDKWRPVNTTVMLFVFRVLKDSYLNFFWFGSALVAVIMVSFYLICRSATGWSQNQSKLIPLLGAIVVGTSPFTFAGRSGVIGFLEFAPIICCLMAFYMYQSAKRQGSRLLVVYSSILALTGGLIHERYFAFSLAQAIVIAIHARKEARFRGFWLLYVANIGFYVLVANVVLDLNILRGGGEVPLSASLGSWIPFRLVFGLLHMFGAAGGETVYFNSTNPTHFILTDGFSNNYSLVFPILLTTILLTSVAYRLHKLRQSTYQRVKKTSLPASVEAFAVAIVLLIPSATVVSRIETRWLFGSLVFLCLAVALSSRLVDPVSLTLTFLLFCVFLGSNIFHRDSYEKFDFWKFRASQIVNEVRSNAPSSGRWNVVIHLPAVIKEDPAIRATSEASPRNKRIYIPSEDNNDLSFLIWALGYGNDEPFLPLNNPPENIYFVTQRTEIRNCQRPCLIVNVQDVGNSTHDIRRFEFQQVGVDWL